MLARITALRSSFASLATSAAVCAALAAPASAQFNLFNWKATNPPGSGVVTLTPDLMHVIAFWPTIGGGAFMGYSAVAPVAGRITVDMAYIPFDGACNMSVPVFVVNGTTTVLATCFANETLLLSVPAHATFSLGLLTYDGTFPGWVDFTNFHFDSVPPFTAWTDLGNGLAGSTGVPALTGTALLYPQFPITLQLSDAAANAPVALFVGLTQLDAPFKGGVLVPAPDVLLPGLVTDAHGALELSAQWPLTPSGFVFYVQAWIADAGGPHGFAASNALHAQTP